MRRNYSTQDPTYDIRGTSSGTSSGISSESSSGSSPGICTAVIGSMTQAMKAQAVLGEAAIRTTLTKISSGRTHNGCAYGVDFPCTQSGNVRVILGNAGVRVRDYLRD